MDSKTTGKASRFARMYARLYRKKHFFWAGAIRFNLASKVATIGGSVVWFMTAKPFMKPAAAMLFVLGVAQVYGTIRYEIPLVHLRYLGWRARRERHRSLASR